MAAEPESEGESRPVSTRSNGSPDWPRFAGVGFEFIVAVLLLGGVGWWLDRRFGSAPWIMLGGGLLGFVIGLRQLMRTVNRNSKR